ncbi:sialate O-acetylesterase [Chryseolinea soli]|uniref:Sialate O-acetylesterase domain-containing protein n=1 Tax=Chryseolinea soli TaxID=2321403 RepID=A0A385SMJ2_9BACT|nr:sialate O-acetylesterase [Chryseolinea soli]AYB31571.1 hypothetical protein D4L85_13765 [Chryseolinea soli]
MMIWVEGGSANRGAFRFNRVASLFACCLFVSTLLMNAKTFAQEKTLWLIAGQSNAVGQGDSTLSPKCENDTAWEYAFTSDALRPLADPAGVKELNFERANNGSLAPAFASRMVARQPSSSVVIVSAARGGASCHQKAELNNYGTWDTRGNLMLFEDAITKVKAAEKKTAVTLSGILWLQGERDANAINDGKLTPLEYEAALTTLIARFRKALGKDVPFYIVQTGYFKDHPHEGFDAVRRAQQNVADKDKFTNVIYTETNRFEAKGWMKDQIHYNQIGLNHIGAAVADALSNFK